MIAVEEEDLSNITKAEQDLHGRFGNPTPGSPSWTCKKVNLAWLGGCCQKHRCCHTEL